MRFEKSCKSKSEERCKAMLVMVFAAYLLLALPVRACVKIAVQGLSGTLTVEIRAAGIHFAREKRIALRRGSGGSGRQLLFAIRQSARPERIEAFARVGTGDAMHTALLAGSLRAAIASMLLPLGAPRDTRVLVQPVFDRRCLSFRFRCIFSVCAGDIMIAAARAAMKLRRNEGERWSSIPSRA